MLQKTTHFIGIGGIGMSGLAHILLAQNQRVTGSDISSNFATQKLESEGAIVYLGHSETHITSDCQVIYSSDIKKNNVEYQAALRLGCPLLHRSELLAQLIANKRSLAVAGTHGKTTTSSLLATVLIDAGTNCSYAIGGKLLKSNKNSEHGSGKDFVLEADESDGSFLNYHPYGAIITNIDNDHLIAYNFSFSHLIDAFHTFARQVKSKEFLFWCGDDQYLQQLDLSHQSYGFSKHCRWKITSWKQIKDSLIFNVFANGKEYKEIQIALMGKHNALNATAVFALAMTMGIDENSIRSTFKNFSGVGRRAEKKGLINGALMIDDYAHHPTEIETTLQGIRASDHFKRLIAVFQPHRYSRIKECLEEFTTVFDAVDELIVTDIFSAGETKINGIDSLAILDTVQKNSSVNSKYVSRKELCGYLVSKLNCDTILVTLGAGDITHLSAELFASANINRKS